MLILIGQRKALGTELMLAFIVAADFRIFPDRYFIPFAIISSDKMLMSYIYIVSRLGRRACDTQNACANLHDLK